MSDSHDAAPADTADEVTEEQTGVVLQVDDVEDQVTHLLRGEIEVEGRMPYSSNATFLVHVTHDERTHPAIYKPLRGERPLWDFEPGLHRREVAAYRLSETLGVGVVPATVLRDGPLGEGSVQWFVVADHSEHYFTIYESRPDLHDRLRDIAALDLLANNTDRKSGHCLFLPERRDDEASVWAIDNGLCFAAAFKLRTVMWDFAGQPLPADLRRAVARFAAEGPPIELRCLLDSFENDAMLVRAAALAEAGVYPDDDTGGHRYPWPLV